jgi:hypothetical protein
VPPVAGPGDEVGQLPHLLLPHTAGVQRVVEHDHEHVHRSPGAVDDDQ